MKIRQGFVSNSSSSSFVVIGVDIASDLNTLAKSLGVRVEEECTYETVEYLNEYLSEKGYQYISFYYDGENDLSMLGFVAMGDECSHFDSQEISLTDIQDELDIVSDLFGIKDMPIKLVTGVKAT